MPNARLALITYFGNQPVDPAYGVEAPPQISNELPPLLLPVFPTDPSIDNSLPEPPTASTKPSPTPPARPDQSLPSQPGHPSQQPIRAGMKFVVKKVCGTLVLVPDNTLPETPTAQPKR